MSLTFTTVLNRLAATVQAELNEDSGDAKILRQEEHRLTNYLNQAATWIWRGKYQHYAIEDILTGTSATLATGGIIEAADIDSADFWSVWSSDPRLALPEARARLALRATAKANGDLLIENGNSGDTVFVFYRTRVPKWTAVTASGYTAPVSLNTRLWNKECNNDGDGHVYRALAADVSPDDFTVTASWLPITLPEPLLEVINAKAMAIKFRSETNFEAAQGWENFAHDWMEARARQAEQQPGEKPWLYNQNV